MKPPSSTNLGSAHNNVSTSNLQHFYSHSPAMNTSSRLRCIASEISMFASPEKPARAVGLRKKITKKLSKCKIIDCSNDQNNNLEELDPMISHEDDFIDVRPVKSQNGCAFSLQTIENQSYARRVYTKPASARAIRAEELSTKRTPLPPWTQMFLHGDDSHGPTNKACATNTVQRSGHRQ